MFYLVIESYRGRDPLPAYRRLRERGRQIPAGVGFISSWVTEDLSRCYQVMEAAEREALDRWMAQWSDLVEFEVLPVLTSASVQELLAP